MDAVRQVVAATPLTAVFALAGCGNDADVARPQTGLADELAAHNGQVCPDQLPQGEDPDGYGFGTYEPADERPSLLTPDAAWVCIYDPVPDGPGPDGDGSTLRWQRDGKPQPVDSTRLAALTEHLDQLKPADDGRVCTDDLGPRWMLVFTHKSDLTGVVIDDYGCHDIRLTDQPFETAPGDPGQEGTVPGVLSGPAQLLADLNFRP
jgi:hypothetical protein